MNTASRWPFGMALCMWILGEIACITQAPAWMVVWSETVVATRSGLPAWRVLVAWGLGNRWLEAAPEARQRFADGCGAAALQVLLQSRGLTLSQTLLWNLTRLPAGGTSLHRMAAIAARFGVECRVHRPPRRDDANGNRGNPSEMPEPVVLHLSRAHFVVLLHMAQSKAFILDPALGLILVRRESLQRQVSGLALSCDAAPGREPPNRRRVWGERIP